MNGTKTETTSTTTAEALAEMAPRLSAPLISECVEDALLALGFWGPKDEHELVSDVLDSFQDDLQILSDGMKDTEFSCIVARFAARARVIQAFASRAEVRSRCEAGARVARIDALEKRLDDVRAQLEALKKKPVKRAGKRGAR